MSGRRRRDDGWDEGRRDPRNGYQQPDAQGGNGYAGASSGMTGQGYSTPSFQPFGDGGAATGYSGAGYPDRGEAGYGTAGYSGYPGQPDSAGYPRGGYDNGSGGAVNGYGGGAGYGGGHGYEGGAGYGGTGRGTASQFVPEFVPADEDGAGNDGPVGTPRPVGRLSIFTLLDDRAGEFDRLAERAAEGVRATEPDTLVYVIHVVPKAPMQRIIYEIYRDRAAFESHERQPHIQRFVADRASCVLATNIIDLRLKYAKVAALGTTSAGASAAPSSSVAETRVSRGAPEQEPAAQYAADNWAAAGTGQYAASTAQYQAASASFTPSDDRYAAAAGQYGAAAAGQYGYAADGGYSGAGEYSGNSGYQAPGYQVNGAGQYPVASDGYAAQTGTYAANGTGQYAAPASGYSANGYSANGYSANGGYAGTAAYPGAANGGYSGQAGTGYGDAAGTGYADQAGGYAAAATGMYSTAANGYAGSAGGGYAGAQNGYATGSAGYNGSGYSGAGYSGTGDSGTGYNGVGRYRELSAGTSTADEQTESSAAAGWDQSAYPGQRYGGS